MNTRTLLILIGVLLMGSSSLPGADGAASSDEAPSANEALMRGDESGDGMESPDAGDAAAGQAGSGPSAEADSDNHDGSVAGRSPAGADGEGDGKAAFTQATSRIEQQVQEATQELRDLNEQVTREVVPLSRRLGELEAELAAARREYQDVSRKLDSRTLDLANLRNEIKSRQSESNYLSNLLGEYIRNFESRLHIAEVQRYEQALRAAKEAQENTKLHSEKEIFAAQSEVVKRALERMHEVLGGTRFDGTAVNPEGRVVPGRFALIGPVAIFRSKDGKDVGVVEPALNSVEPNVMPFSEPTDTEAAAKVVQGTGKTLPLDPTMGEARKIEETSDSLWEHIQKGGPVMIPIFTLAGIALLVAIYKWVALARVRRPTRKQIDAMLDAVAKSDKAGAVKAAKAVSGPTGEMLTAGAEHLEMPRELIEEIMYEKMLSSRLKLQRLLPFINITAASAPLLGLLGTVVGIINTFEMINIFGTGDVKSLSGGISEALITTEFGLIVAIPSLILHAYLSRKAKGVVDQMEKSGVALINQLGKTPYKEPLEEAA